MGMPGLGGKSSRATWPLAAGMAFVVGAVLSVAVVFLGWAPDALTTSLRSSSSGNRANPPVAISVDVPARPIHSNRPTSANGTRLSDRIAPAMGVPPATDPVGDYLDWLQRTMISVDEATSTLLDLEHAPVHDAAWNMQVTGAVSVWTSAYHNAMAEQPPSSLAATHVVIVKAFSQFNGAASTVLQAASDGDDDLLATGIDEALAGGRALTAAFEIPGASPAVDPTATSGVNVGPTRATMAGPP